MNKKVFTVLFSMMALGSVAQAYSPNRIPGNYEVGQYLQEQVENAPNCPLASKQSRSPFDNIGTCTTLNCKSITLENRSFNINGSQVR